MAKQVAHEIRNPLTPMKLIVQHLEMIRRQRPDNLEEYLIRSNKVLLDQIDNLEKIVVTGEAGAGMVKATVNGKKKVIAVEIDATIISAANAVLVQDLVVAAVNKAMEEADIKAKDEIKRSTEGILPSIPGLDLSSMIG